MASDRDVETLLAAYPRIYFACHARHVRDPDSGAELSAHQASILSHLDDVEPTRLTELAEHMGVTASTMSLTVKRLARQGYVSRAPDPHDGRAVHLRLSPSGVRVRDAQSVLDPERVMVLLEQLSGKERERALEGLRLLADAADRVVRSWSAGAGGRVPGNGTSGEEVA